VSAFDTVVVVDWSAASTLAPVTPAPNAIWIGVTRDGEPAEPVYCRGRAEAESAVSDLFRAEAADGRRVLAGFDFPFAYPAGFSRKVAGTDDPLRMWSWLGARVKDNARNANNRFDVAEKINRQFRAPGPFWGRPHQGPHRYPELFVLREYTDALARYQEAIGRWDHPAIRFNIAECYISLVQPLKAYENLELALAESVLPELTEALSYTAKNGKTYQHLQAKTIKGVLDSAIANADQAEANLRDLIVTDARADAGPTMKRFQPKDRGRAHPILKRTSHLTIAVDAK